MKSQQALENLIDAFAELAKLHNAAASVAVRARELVASSMAMGNWDETNALSDRPIVCKETCTVLWRGQQGQFKPGLLVNLLAYLARRPNIYRPNDNLMDNVWERRCEQSTIRQAIRRLRQTLKDSGMGELAACIQCHDESCGLILNGDALKM